MRKVNVVLTTVGMLVMASLVYQVTGAQSSEPLSGAHLEKVRRNCNRAQAALERLHTSDAHMRRNRGELYEPISTKLMAPLNSRIAYDKLDGLKLASTALRYDDKFREFRTSYIDYERSMTKTVAIDCEKNPETFYRSVATTRQKRQKVHADTQDLINLIEEYKDNFEDFAKRFAEGSV